MLPRGGGSSTVRRCNRVSGQNGGANSRNLAETEEFTGGRCAVQAPPLFPNFKGDVREIDVIMQGDLFFRVTVQLKAHQIEPRLQWRSKFVRQRVKRRSRSPWENLRWSADRAHSRSGLPSRIPLKWKRFAPVIEPRLVDMRRN